MPWDFEWKDYKPVDFTAPSVTHNSRENFAGPGQPGHHPAKGWADPSLQPTDVAPAFPNPLQPDELRRGRFTYTKNSSAAASSANVGATSSPVGQRAGGAGGLGKGQGAGGQTLEDAGIQFGDGTLHDRGAPLNPYGRTGMKGRGLLGKWGPNHAADPIVTRLHPESGKLQMVAIERKDTGEWAIPGGMVDPGEQVSATVKREFEEETGNVPEGQRVEYQAHVQQLFSSGETVYRGYVDDPRNTDNAWMETTAMWFHCDELLGRLLTLAAGDDAARAAWIDMDSETEPRFANLYGDHRLLTQIVLTKYAAQQVAPA